MIDVAVIGAGPAGCAAAVALAQGGREVVVLDRHAEARECVCGEFLGADAARALRRLGLDLPALGALPLRRLRLGAGGREAGVTLPFAAWSLPRRDLDGALRARAVAAGAEVRGGAAVQVAEWQGGAWRLRCGGREVVARRVVLATGKHAMRGHPRDGAGAGSLGLKLHLRGVALPAEIALLPFAGGYAGLQPRPGKGADGGANLCGVIAGGKAGVIARDPAALLARVAGGSALAARLLSGAVPEWDRPLAIGAVPYGFRHRGTGGPPGLYRVGDQTAVIPSCAGEGVAMALHSGLHAGQAILAGQEAAAFHAGWLARIGGAMRWGGAAGGLLGLAPGFVVGVSGALPAVARVIARRTRMAA